MLFKGLCRFILTMNVLSLVTASPIRQSLDLSNASAFRRTADTAVQNTTANWSNSHSTPSTKFRKRAPTTLYLSGCTSVLNWSLRDPSVVRKPGPFHLSPEGGLYLTHRLENAEAMARLEFKNCVPVHVNGFLSKFMVVSYDFDDTGLNIMDLDNWHWYQHDSVIANLPNWCTGSYTQSFRLTEKSLLNHSTLTPAAHYGAGLTDLWSLWVLKMGRDDPNRINPISRLSLVKVNHYMA
ncbi:hypothetical protein GGU10DRAFT_434323 [Lentinula aff. detonsa]|uniref:Uncharacterized protein n=1 Tax=Lentinula aff. detonsa TaxID=2804958 RepID=A0AA38NJI6_9AGAR|nr:hypothetical protein GGU10DRAFT_434323 [Lentinula aff. detonsa]